MGLSPTVEGEPSGLDVDTTEAAKSVRIPGYEVLEELGRGGMGVVYKARQQSLDRIVALKMILAASHAGSTATARFLHEAKTIALLKHPHVVQVYEFGSHEGKPFFSLEYLEGGSLADKLRGEPQPPAQAAQMVQTLAQAVQAAHEQGIVHRDLKPANVLLAADGTPKITDFGVAKQGDSVMTATGDVLGTPSYMAPEQAEGKTKLVGPAADIYALGAILYELLTGRPPFKGASAWETIQLVTNSEPVTPCQLQPRCAARPGNDLSQVPGERAGQTLCDGEGSCRRSAAFPGGRADPGPSGWKAQSEPGRWCLRNKAVAASLAAVALSLLAATVVSVVFGLRADRARQAEAERGRGETKAKQEAVQARRDVQQQLIDLSTEVRPGGGPRGRPRTGPALVCPDSAALRRLPRARGVESNPVRQLAPARLDPGGHDGDPGLSPGAGPIPAVDVLARWELSRGHRQRGRLPALGPASGPARPAHGASGWGRRLGTNVRTAGPRRPRWHDPRAGSAGLHAGRGAAGRRRRGCLDVQPRRPPAGLGRYQRRPDLGPGDEAVLHPAPEAWRAGRHARLQRGRGDAGDLGTRHESPCLPGRFRAGGSRLPTRAPCHWPNTASTTEARNALLLASPTDDRVLLTVESSGAVYNLRWRSAASGEVLTTTDTAARSRATSVLSM